MAEDPEVARIRTTYRGYDASAAEQAKRDPGNPGNAEIQRHREAALAALLESFHLPTTDVLDAGCGSGDTLALLLRLGADRKRLMGVDLLEDRVDAARQALPGVRVERADLRHLDLPDAVFDLVICSLLFGSVLDLEVARAIAAELARVLRHDGKVLWYESRYPNPFNRNVRGWNRRQLRRLFPGFELELRPITLLPPLARRLGPGTGRLYPLLTSVRPLRSHYLGLLTRA